MGKRTYAHEADNELRAGGSGHCPCDSFDGTSPAAAVGCTLAGVNDLFGRTVRLWDCGAFFYGQITGAQAGDSVEVLVTTLFTGGPVGRQYVQPGSTTVNSLSTGKFGTHIPYSACIHIGDRPGAEACT